MNNQLYKHYLVEVPLDTVSSGQRYLIGDIPALKDRKIFAIDALNSNSLIFTPGGRTIIALTATQNITISLTYAGASGKQEEISNIPYLALNSYNNKFVLSRFAGVKFDLSKSYLTLWDGAIAIPGTSALLSFYYE